ncbi:hypothetical protein [Pinirhizobacter sp.]|uniref:hypothetical protein n=1 Tax=Pinirhizobacter sp. TaxID=2950432 RepID=UPI002F3FAC93
MDADRKEGKTDSRSRLNFAMRLIVASLFVVPVVAAADPECQSEKIDGVLIEMCLLRGGHFKHDVYLMRSNGIPVFGIADDFVEKVSLIHKLSEGLALEFPFSRGGSDPVEIKGGCAPVTQPFKPGDKLIVEVARVCNFTWGARQVVKNVRFSFD